jgi:hypothetical protein
MLVVRRDSCSIFLLIPSSLVLEMEQTLAHHKLASFRNASGASSKCIASPRVRNPTFKTLRGDLGV